MKARKGGLRRAQARFPELGMSVGAIRLEPVAVGSGHWTAEATAFLREQDERERAEILNDFRRLGTVDR